MARKPKEKYPAKFLVEQLHISDKYLRRILTNLSKEGIIVSTQGRGGGYTFNKKIQDIFLADIIDASEGMEKYLGCVLGFNECSDEHPCAFHHSWVSVREKISNHLNSTSLADINMGNNIKN